jgi:hypothetical protein
VDVASQGQGFSNGLFYSSGGLEFANRPDTTGGGGAHSHSVWTNGESNGHTHNFSGTTDSAGSGVAHENRPPYFARAYIMKA